MHFIHSRKIPFHKKSKTLYNFQFICCLFRELSSDIYVSGKAIPKKQYMFVVHFLFSPDTVESGFYSVKRYRRAVLIVICCHLIIHSLHGLPTLLAENFPSPAGSCLLGDDGCWKKWILEVGQVCILWI